MSPLSGRSGYRAPDPVAPRYAPARTFPRYAYIVGGSNPHPTRDAAGHSHGHEEPAPPPGAGPDGWREVELYRFGFDLYHAGFLWEAHEAWERVWNAVGRGSPEHHLVQGLILTAAATIKVHEGLRGTALRIGVSIARHFQAAASGGPSGVVWGICVADALQMNESWMAAIAAAERVSAETIRTGPRYRLTGWE